jgi:hypothetical protein
MEKLQDDAALVVLARGGDREALGELLERHYPAALRLCRRLLGASHEAQDVAQEAALQALLGLSCLREPGRFGAWLLAVAANLARMALRRRRHLSLDVLGDGTALVLWPPPAPTPQDVQEARETHDAIVAALGELPPHERDAAVGFFLEGYSYAELAELLGVPVSTVKGRLFKGRRRLQRALGPVAGEALQTHRSQQKERAMSENDLVPVTIVAIRVNLMTQHRVVVLRETGGERVLPIWIGPFEADAIALALQGQQPHRPMTHDMALRLLEPVGAQVRQVVVNKIVEQTFFAEIALEIGGQTHTVDARPSDAFALAVRTSAPIFVAKAVMNTAATIETPEERDGVVIRSTLGDELAGTLPSGEPLPPPPPLLLPTMGLLSQLVMSEAESSSMWKMAGVNWDERFPAREIEWEGATRTAVRLREGEDAAWLMLPPALWERVTSVAKREIENERWLQQELARERQRQTQQEP